VGLDRSVSNISQSCGPVVAGRGHGHGTPALRIRSVNQLPRTPSATAAAPARSRANIRRAAELSRRRTGRCDRRMWSGRSRRCMGVPGTRAAGCSHDARTRGPASWYRASGAFSED
jgi:hypothetical protein